MNHFNLLMVLQTLVDFFEGYFLQQFYGDFFAERFRRKSWNQMGVVIAYVMFQYIKKLFLPAKKRFRLLPVRYGSGQEELEAKIKDRPALVLAEGHPAPSPPGRACPRPNVEKGFPKGEL